jgi:hypothetical protein
MTITPPTGEALYAALSEQVYNRDAKDQSLTDDDIFGQGVVPGKAGIITSGLLLDAGDGYYYQQGLDNGFAARVVQQDGKFIVVLRGITVGLR